VVAREVVGGMVLSKVEHAPGDGMDRAEVGVATVALTDNFPHRCHFLVSEVRVAKSLVRRVGSGVLARSRLFPRVNSWTSARQKGLVLWPMPVYLLGCRRK